MEVVGTIKIVLPRGTTKSAYVHLIGAKFFYIAFVIERDKLVDNNNNNNVCMYVYVLLHYFYS